MDGRVRVLGTAVDIGAYEIDCKDVSNEWDSNADSLVNYYEFAKFSRTWLAHDPNDPAIIDPQHPDHGYRTEPNSPGYVSEAQKAAWYPDGPQLNVAAFGDSEYAIDLVDLMILVEDAPWLWVACWRTDIWQQQAMAMFMQPKTGGLEPLAIESQESIFSPHEERETVMGLLEQIDVFIDSGGEDAEAWTELRYLLEHTLTDIEETTNQTEKF